MQNLDSCSVMVFPTLNPDHEEIQVDGDESLSSTLDIKTNINKDGVEMIGNDAIENYLDVLKALLYSNKKPAYYLNRVFKLACTQLNSEFKSQEFTLTLTVLHPKLAPKTTIGPTSVFGVAESSLYGISNVNGAAVGSTSPSKLYHGQIQAYKKSYIPIFFLFTDNRLFAHAMIHSHDIQEPKVQVHSIIHKGRQKFKL